jgi:ribulose-phosphate 3-epimerase
VAEFVKAGAHSVTFHAESTPNVAYTANLLHDLGACVGVAINPATPAAALLDIAHELDVALAMTVNPGWGGQPFIKHSLEKLRPVRATIGEAVALEVDGGIDVSTAPQCLQAGANLFVAGSAIFGAADPGEAYRAIARSVDAD